VARITIEDCLGKVPSRFQLVHMAAKRVRQIREGSEYLVSSPKNEDIVVALREIAADKVRVKTAGALVETEAVIETPEPEVAEQVEETEDSEDSEETEA
jgi:DNA-directed RNA polymerase subunit omega